MKWSAVARTSSWRRSERYLREAVAQQDLADAFSSSLATLQKLPAAATGAIRELDGTLSSRPALTSRTAALARRRLQESVDRGEVNVCRDTFETFWNRLAAEQRAYLTKGLHDNPITHGRKRLVPFFGADRVSTTDEDWMREWLDEMVEMVEADELAPKTVNNARTRLRPRAMKPSGAG